MSTEDLTRDQFANLVNEEEERLKTPDFFSRASESTANELCVLRRWNSHTPSVEEGVLGGGYFLRWQGRGTIIDPGCSFIRNFRKETKYSIDDVDMVIVTHDHVDHCQDLGTLVSLFRQFNKWQVKNNNEAPRIWDMIVSYGVSDQLTSLLNHPDNAPFLFWRKVLADRRHPIPSPQDTPGFLKDAADSGLLVDEAYLKAFRKRASTRLINQYCYKLEALPAKHKELLGASTAFGLRFTLRRKVDGSTSPKKGCTIAISGDTGIRQRAKLVPDYGKADLLILHVGSMEESGKPYKGDHLCFNGVVEILEAIANKSTKAPKLVVLTEWGYEFRRAGLTGRTQFTRYVADELNGARGLANRFYAAVAGSEDKPPVCPDGAIVILPADIGLRIRLPDMAVFAQGRFIDCQRVFARECGERIDYLTI